MEAFEYVIYISILLTLPFLMEVLEEKWDSIEYLIKSTIGVSYKSLPRRGVQ